MIYMPFGHINRAQIALLSSKVWIIPIVPWNLFPFSVAKISMFYVPFVAFLIGLLMGCGFVPISSLCFPFTLKMDNQIK